MNDLIERQAAIDALKKQMSDWNDDYNVPVRKSIENIERLPSAQPERKNGKWEITEAYPHNVFCSECHKKFAQTHWAVWEDGSLPRNFCPNCGAEMREDGEADEAD